MRSLCLLALTALVAGCASTPSAETPAQEKEAVTLAPAAATPAAAAVAMTDDGEFKPPAGYKRRVENGQIYYCTKTVVLGSRFPKDDCRSQAELEDLEQQKASMRGEMDQRIGVCGSAAGCANN